MDEFKQRESNRISKIIIGAAIDVHRNLGPGLLENAYEECMCFELKLKGLSFERQKNMSINYKGQAIECGYRLDLLVENLVIVELKSTALFLPIHEAQLLTYLKLSDLWLGILINFNVVSLKDGIKRLVQG